MCVNLYKDGDFRFFSKNQGDARLRGHDNLIKLYRSNNPDYSSEESSST